MMCTAAEPLVLPAQQQIVQHWLAGLRRQYPRCDAARVETQIHDAIRNFYKFLSGYPAAWDLNPLMLLLSRQPSFQDLAHVFSTLRAAVRAAISDSSKQTVLCTTEHLDNWITQVVMHYDVARSHRSQQRWQDMVQRLSRLNTLSYCVAELNTSLDLASAFSATVELARVLTDADVCLLYQRDGDMLRLRAAAGAAAEPVAAIPLAADDMLQQVVIDRQRHDIPLAVVRQHLNEPQVRAIHCLPLLTSSVISGKLTFVYFNDRTFTLQELRVQEIYAGHAAQALYNAQLYERLSGLTAANERRQIACEMHDTLLQTLIALNINVRVMENYAQQGRWDDVLPLIETVRALGKVAAQEGRDTLNDLRECDGSFRERNLIDALQPEITAFAHRAGIAPQFTFANAVPVPSAVSHHLCRLVGEALTNVHRHASATGVTITVETAPGEVCVRVRDNGVGFQPARVDQHQSFGLMGMHERARLIDAQVTIDTAPAKGTTVTIKCPLPATNGKK
jgi:signal transduction histidine kinase